MESYFQIVLGVLGVVIVTLATIWARWAKAKRLLTEMAEALNCLSTAIADDDVTKEELENLTKEFTDVIEAGRDLIAR